MTPLASASKMYIVLSRDIIIKWCCKASQSRSEQHLLRLGATMRQTFPRNGELISALFFVYQVLRTYVDALTCNVIPICQFLQWKGWVILMVKVWWFLVFISKLPEKKKKYFFHLYAQCFLLNMVCVCTINALIKLFSSIRFTIYV